MTDFTYWYIHEGAEHHLNDQHVPPTRGWAVFVLASEYDRLRQTLQNIVTNKLTSSTNRHPQYAAGVSHGLGIAADMARKALEGGTSNSLEHVRQSPQDGVPTKGAPSGSAAQGATACAYAGPCDYQSPPHKRRCAYFWSGRRCSKTDGHDDDCDFGEMS